MADIPHLASGSWLFMVDEISERGFIFATTQKRACWKVLGAETPVSVCHAREVKRRNRSEWAIAVVAAGLRNTGKKVNTKHNALSDRFSFRQIDNKMKYVESASCGKSAMACPELATVAFSTCLLIRLFSRLLMCLSSIVAQRAAY